MRMRTPLSRRRHQLPPTAWGSVSPPGPAEPDTRLTNRYPGLDVQRGIAVLLVVTYHVYQFCGLQYVPDAGTTVHRVYRVMASLDAIVPWFFVITAFLLFEPVVRAVADGGPPFRGRLFLSRRAVGLLPAYYLALVVVWLPRQSGLPGDWRDLVEHLTFTHVFDSKRIFYTIGPAWALSAVVLFYLVMVVVAVAGTRIFGRFTSRRRRLLALAGAVAVPALVSVGWKAWAFGVLHRPRDGAFPTWFGPLAQLDAFAIGMGAALILVAGGSARSARHRPVLLLTAGALLVVAFTTREPGTWTDVYFTTSCSLAFGCLTIAGARERPATSEGRLRAHAGFRAGQWLGVISFSIYLWHEPVMLALRTPGVVIQSPDAFSRDLAVVLIASIGVGWLSYTFVERPSRQLWDMFHRRRSDVFVRPSTERRFT